MKKIYKKPILIVESYQLDTGIATCSSEGGVVLNYDAETCSFDAGGMVYYTNSSCNEDPVNPNDFGDDVCYHGLNNGMGLTFLAS